VLPRRPSGTKMRSWAMRWSVVSIAVRVTITSSCSSGRCLGAYVRTGPVARPQSEEVADGVSEVGTVHGVEMKIAHTLFGEAHYLLSGDGRGDQLACGRVFVEAFEPRTQPIGHGSAGPRGEVLCLDEILHRQYAGYDRNIDAGSAHFLEIAEVQVVLEEELRNGSGRASVDFRFEHVDVGGDASAFGMLLWISGDRYFEIGDAFDAADQIRGILVAAGVGRKALANAAERVAAQRHDMAHAGPGISVNNFVDFRARSSNAGYVRGRN